MLKIASSNVRGRKIFSRWNILVAFCAWFVKKLTLFRRNTASIITIITLRNMQVNLIAWLVKPGLIESTRWNKVSLVSSLSSKLPISSEAATKVSFLIAETIAKKWKPFSDGQLVKDCLQIFTDVVFPDKSFVENVSLSHQSVARRLVDMAANIEDAWVQRLSGCKFCSLALDESTNISDTAQLAIFVRGLAITFDVVEKLLDIYPLKGTTTGKDVFAKVNQVIKKFKLSMNKLIGITTDGITGKQNGFVTLLAKSVPHEIIAHHCIIHQENLCAKTLEWSMR